MLAQVLDAVAAAWRLLPDVVVYDTQPVRISDPDVLVVGWSASAPSSTLAQRYGDVGGGREERIELACLVSCLRGERDAAAASIVRTRTIELLDAAAAALAADPSLGGLVERAELGLALSFDQAQSDKGTSSTVEFSVVAEVL